MKDLLQALQNSISDESWRETVRRRPGLRQSDFWTKILVISEVTGSDHHHPTIIHDTT